MKEQAFGSIYPRNWGLPPLLSQQAAVIQIVICTFRLKLPVQATRQAGVSSVYCAGRVRIPLRKPSSSTVVLNCNPPCAAAVCDCRRCQVWGHFFTVSALAGLVLM